MIQISKKHITNIAFVLLIGLLVYPPTKIYFIRLFSFSPKVEDSQSQKKLENPNWYLKGLNTKSINLAELDQKVVFVSFWATWCPPCTAEMPSMKALYRDYKDQVMFLFITDESWSTVAKFYSKNTYSFPTYHEQNQAPKEFEHTSIPVTYIVSKERRIVVSEKGAANWNTSAIRKLLDSLIKQKKAPKKELFSTVSGQFN